MKPHTIKNAFQNSGMCPVSTKVRIQKMRHYTKGTKSYQKDHRQNREHSPSLLPLLKDLISQSKQAFNEWIKKNPTTWSSPSRHRHVEALKSAKMQLNYVHLVDFKRQLMHARLTEDQNRQNNSQKSLHKGGAISVLEAWKKKSNHQEKEKKMPSEKLRLLYRDKLAKLPRI